MEETNNDQQPRFSMKGQYIKDLSLENPNAPENLMTMKEQPRVDLNLDLQGRRVADNFYELAITASVKTLSGEQVLFVLDLTYAGLFELVNIPEELIERVLLVDSAFALFPFARRVVADITRDSGFPPLMLDPIDFLGLYEQRRRQEAEQASQPVATAAIN
ncbi:MAG: protein-export chaperone SecB [Alphaproteobacteria bacterium]|nr:MAG: protein-export chaperone SecB [Alphaproteobacteria bacterium]TAF15507.1 MAG: protein-export chaperone SecB [Alphaproteobacteria bacterium]TAF40958.1 MAG: protein-export chaperone SecB [Alphaproteobacteria bacterium]